jgi:hypothetical protein
MVTVTVTVMVMVTRRTIDRDRDCRDDNCTRASFRDQRTLANEAMIRGFRADRDSHERNCRLPKTGVLAPIWRISSCLIKGVLTGFSD